ncbi:ALP1-like protein isoform X1 [Tanacetum coccineum]
MSISALMKCTAAIRQMAYDSTPDAFDEYLQMSEHTARDALFFFNMSIIELYMPKGDKKYPTIVLEAVASQYLWIWHAFYGMAGANNDINVLDNSPLFDDLLDDLAPVRQESGKDVERAFGVLQGRWGLIQQPASAYEVNTLRRIMYAGIIVGSIFLNETLIYCQLCGI